MKKIKFLLVMLTISSMLLGQDEAWINSADQKIDSIDRQIAELMEKKEALEKLRAKFAEEKNIMEELKQGKFSRTRPKVALVLSGGGTNGAAHIGILKMLDKYKVPIDYIAGTSAGSIIGAMYSIGYSPEEIEYTINNINYGKMLTNMTSNNLGEIIERSKVNKYPLSLTVDENLNIAVPAGVLTGEYIYLQLKEIFSRADDIKDFSQLPIPFRAVTTDLDSGSAVVLEEGDLALATFKSMAVPTLIEPIRDEGKFYIDGGIADNFPVRAALDMGADLIIGVDISRDAIEVDDQASIIGILTKLSTYKGVENTEINKEMTDIVIEPQVKVRSLDDFNDFHSLVKLGEGSSEKVEYILENLRDEKAFEAFKTRSAQLQSEEVKISGVKLTGNNVLTMETVMSISPGEALTDGMTEKKSLNIWAEKIYALPYVSRVFYEVKDEILEFKIREQVESKLNLGVYYQSNYGAGLELSAEMPFYPKTGLFRSYALKGELSKYPKISGKISSHKKFLERDFTFMGEASLETSPLFIYRGKDNISDYVERKFQGYLSAGTSFFDRVTLNYGLDIKKVEVGYDSGMKLNESEYPLGDQSYLTNSFNLYFKYLDSEFFPTEGGKLIAQIFLQNAIEERENFQGYMFDSGVYIPITKKFSVDLEMSGGEMKGSEKISYSERFRIGGLTSDFLDRNFAFSGLPLGAVMSEKFMSARGAVQFRIKPGLYLIGKYNVLTFEDDYIFNSRKKLWKDYLVGYGIGGGRDTFLGPIDIFITNNVLGGGLLFQFRLGYTF